MIWQSVNPKPKLGRFWLVEYTWQYDRQHCTGKMHNATPLICSFARRQLGAPETGCTVTGFMRGEVGAEMGRAGH